MKIKTSLDTSTVWIFETISFELSGGFTHTFRFFDDLGFDFKKNDDELIVRALEFKQCVFLWFYFINNLWKCD